MHTPEFAVTQIAAVAEIRPPLLVGLADAELRAVRAAGIVRKFRAREVMIHQGTPAKRLHLLISGRARYFFVTRQGRKVLLRWLIVGDIAGAAALLPGNVSHLIGTEMVRDGLVLSWDRTTMVRLTTRCPSLLRNALSVIIAYLDWYLIDHVALTDESAGQRVAAILDRLATTIGSSYPEGIGVDVTNRN